MSVSGHKVYTRDNLPLTREEMSLHRKTVLTPMFSVCGPLTVHTQEGEYTLPDGWVGYIALDKEGFPYPISLESYKSSYEPA